MAYLQGWPVTVPTTSAACNSFTLHTWFYKKVGGVFKLTGGGTSKGEWKTSYCKITTAPNTTGYLISQVLPSSSSSRAASGSS
ncbi:MAG TPA: hypothetical protein VEQ42_03375 [Pyrinomonadaceae bacterium]|nr:hypothetical protein [Pyrinomonadaceae bacterium]